MVLKVIFLYIIRICISVEGTHMVAMMVTQKENCEEKTL